MPQKKSKTANSEPVTKEFLAEQIDKVLGVVKGVDEKVKGLDEKIDHTRTFLESRIEFARKDMREHVHSTIQSAITPLNQRMDKMEHRMDSLEGNQAALLDNIKFIRSDVKEIKHKLDGVAEKVERHDEEITFLKSAVSQT